MRVLVSGICACLMVANWWHLLDEANPVWMRTMFGVSGAVSLCFGLYVSRLLRRK
ncbi:hypothetical protein WBG83_14470 [Paenibacillus sp. y28]